MYNDHDKIDLMGCIEEYAALPCKSTRARVEQALTKLIDSSAKAQEPQDSVTVQPVAYKNKGNIFITPEFYASIVFKQDYGPLYSQAAMTALEAECADLNNSREQMRRKKNLAEQRAIEAEASLAECQKREAGLREALRNIIQASTCSAGFVAVHC